MSTPVKYGPHLISPIAFVVRFKQTVAMTYINQHYIALIEHLLRKNAWVGVLRSVKELRRFNPL